MPCGMYKDKKKMKGGYMGMKMSDKDYELKGDMVSGFKSYKKKKMMDY